MTPNSSKLLGHCIPECIDYGFDHSFWEATMITEWDLVCSKSWLKTLAKLLLFTGALHCHVYIMIFQIRFSHCLINKEDFFSSFLNDDIFCMLNATLHHTDCVER